MAIHGHVVLCITLVVKCINLNLPIVNRCPSTSSGTRNSTLETHTYKSPLLARGPGIEVQGL